MPKQFPREIICTHNPYGFHPVSQQTITKADQIEFLTKMIEELKVSAEKASFDVVSRCMAAALKALQDDPKGSKPTASSLC
jgi:hypothetical protein